MRKKGIGIALCVLALSAGASGAEPVFGVKGGWVSGSLQADGPEAFDTSADAGFAIGGFIGFGLGDAVRFQPEVLLSNRRFSSTGPRAPFGVSARGVEVPLLFQLRFPEGRRVQAVLFAGPQVSFISSVTQALGDSESDISDQIKNVDAGVTFGGGVEFYVGRGALSLDARYNVGFRNLDESSGPRLESRAFLALVGYRF
jgi:hypothetical protein